MADIAKTAASIRLVDGVTAVTIPAIAGGTLEAGDFVCYSSGKVVETDADAVATSACIGMVTRSVAANDPCTVLIDGIVSGFTLDDQDAGDTVFLSTTAGAVADAAPSTAGDVIVPVGWVINGTDPSATKLLRVRVTPQNLVAIGA